MLCPALSPLSQPDSPPSDLLRLFCITKGNKLDALRTIFQRLYATDHPIRQNLFALDSLPIIRLIEGKA